MNVFGLGRWIASTLLLGVSSASAVASASVEFNRDVRPILSDNCFACHGPDAAHRKADLRLDVEDDAKRPTGDDAPAAIVPGDPDGSLLIQRITAVDPEDRMPPADSGKQLTASQIDLLRRWIEDGADWQPHWAYAAPKFSATPDVRDVSWPETWIDFYVLEALEARGMRPSPDVDPVTLIRRLSFDLTGLPPEQSWVRAYQDRPTPQRLERIVDRLLGSTAYGERMAAYWLDLVRYADTVGYHGDQTHPISPYRDWVIDAFNDNIPFDEFTRHQLAGDLVPEANTDTLIASGYNRLLQTSHEGGVQPKEYLSIYAADRVRNVSAVWMGATVGCAQCHDHKYDPYTAKDFYALAAFFADIDETAHFKNGSNALPTRRDPELEVLSRFERRLLDDYRRERKRTQLQLESATPDDAANWKQRLRKVDAKIASLEAAKRRTMISRAVEPRTMRVLARGDWMDDTGPIVAPAVPAFLSERNPDRRLTRLDLAAWLTDPGAGAGGLTARVMVNRFWYLCFGRGLAPDLDDFGGQGKPPTHPELLDRLAIEFFESGWDVKRLMKTLVLSRAYRQSSAVDPTLRDRDPYNEWLARQAEFRLPAETIRDSVLVVSGLLNRSVGGASVRPYQPEGYYQHLNFPKREYRPDRDERQWKRSVYMHWQRQFLHPMLKAFDAPSREECTAQRPRSNTPAAALVLLNDPNFVEAARTLALGVLSEAEDGDLARIDEAFVRVLNRLPDDWERATSLEFLQSTRASVEQGEGSPERLLAIGDAPLDSAIDANELAIWTLWCRGLFNLDEAMTRR